MTVELPNEWRVAVEAFCARSEVGASSPKVMRIRRLAIAFDGVNAIATRDFADFPKALALRPSQIHASSADAAMRVQLR